MAAPGTSAHPSGAGASAHPRGGPASRASPRAARTLLLTAVLLVAVCGFVYELVIVALGSYLLGNSVEQVSLVLATFVSSMGLGSIVAKPLLKRPVEAFVVVEVAIGLIGGLSALALYAAFAWLDLYQPAMLVTAAAIGLLVGCEIPLLMAMMQRVRRQDAGESVADLLAADYLGAVVAGVGFPFVLLPLLGHIETALALGVLNLAAALGVLWLMGPALRVGVRRLCGAGLLAAVAVLVVAFALAGRFEVSARQALYEDPIVASLTTPYQDVVVTESLGGDVRLFLNGDLQFSSRDERRYHEALVHPAMAGPHARVAILGGGDGLALREVLRYRDVAAVSQVELDPRVLQLARTDPRLKRLNEGSLDDPRVRVVRADAFAWLRRQDGPGFDVVIADFPDPDDTALAKLYSVELYGLIRRVLRPGGRVVVQSGSPAFARKAFWSIEASMAAADLRTRPYHVDVPSFGDWGFVLARADAAPALRLDGGAGSLQTLDAPTLAAAAVFPPDRRRPAGDLVSTLDRPRIIGFERGAYQDE